MTIGVSTGEQYEDSFSHVTADYSNTDLSGEKPVTMAAGATPQPAKKTEDRVPDRPWPPALDVEGMEKDRQMRELMDPKPIGPPQRLGEDAQRSDQIDIQTSSIGDFFNGLFSKSKPETKVEPAPGLTEYPSDDDVAFARKYGFGYGSGNESHIDQKVARVLGDTKQVPGERGTQRVAFTPKSGAHSYLAELLSAVDDETKSKNIDLTKPENKELRDTLGNTYAAAALTVNRIPIAALGFDPHRVVLDSKMKNPNIAGAYTPDFDSIYANLAAPGVLVHESIHRGFEKLRKRDDLKEDFKSLPSEEYIVRYLMTKSAGDPEKGTGDIADEQRNKALNWFKMHPGNLKALENISKAAEEEIAKRRPRGPK